MATAIPTMREPLLLQGEGDNTSDKTPASPSTTHAVIGNEAHHLLPRPLQVLAERGYVPVVSMLLCVMYMVISVGLMLVNKHLSSGFGFHAPAFLTLCQCVVSILMLLLMRSLHMVSFPLHLRYVRIMALPSIAFTFNVFFGIMCMGALSLPMFTVLRRLANFFIMGLEKLVLSTPWNWGHFGCICIMFSGALVSLWDADGASAPIGGVIMAMLNNLSTGVYLVFLTLAVRKMKGESAATSLLHANPDDTDKQGDVAPTGALESLGVFGQLFYNSVIAVPLLLLMLTTVVDEYSQVLVFSGWNSSAFLLFFLSSCSLAVWMNYAVFLSNSYNSPLVTSIAGQTKNFVITIISFFLSDSKVQPMEVVGHVVSLGGSTLFAYQKARERGVFNKSHTS